MVEQLTVYSVYQWAIHYIGIQGFSSLSGLFRHPILREEQAELTN